MLDVYEAIFAVVEGMRPGDIPPRRSIGTKELLSLPEFGNLNQDRSVDIDKISLQTLFKKS